MTEVRPGRSSVVGSFSSFNVAPAGGGDVRFAQMESTSVMYTGQLKVADQSVHVLHAQIWQTHVSERDATLLRGTKYAKISSTRHGAGQRASPPSQAQYLGDYLRIEMRMRNDNELQPTEVCDLFLARQFTLHINHADTPLQSPFLPLSLQSRHVYTWQLLPTYRTISTRAILGLT